MPPGRTRSVPPACAQPLLRFLLLLFKHRRELIEAECADADDFPVRCCQALLLFAGQQPAAGSAAQRHALASAAYTAAWLCAHHCLPSCPISFNSRELCLSVRTSALWGRSRLSGEPQRIWFRQQAGRRGWGAARHASGADEGWVHSERAATEAPLPSPAPPVQRGGRSGGGGGAAGGPVPGREQQPAAKSGEQKRGRGQLTAQASVAASVAAGFVTMSSETPHFPSLADAAHSC